MSQELFRKEVLMARRANWLGGISLAQPLSLWGMAAFAVIAATLVVGFLSMETYARRSTVTGQLVPTLGISEVQAPATGIVDRMNVTEGGKVHDGQQLAVIRIPRATPGGGDAQAALEQHLDQRQVGMVAAQDAQQQQLRAQAGGLAAQLAAAHRELNQIEAEVVTRQDQGRIAQETLDRFNQLKGTQFISILQIKQQQATVLEYTSDAQALQQQAIDMRRSIAQLEQQIHELPARQQSASASLQRDLAQLNQERVQTQMEGALAVSAPVDGVVATQMVKPGQAVQAGESLMTLLPGSGTLEAQLLVPSHAIGFIEPGDKVLLRYQAYPYQKFGHHLGTVARISRSALSNGELGALIGRVEQGEPYYRVTVALAEQNVLAYGKPEALKPGMLIDADILGEKRRLIEWIFEPLYSIKGRISG